MPAARPLSTAVPTRLDSITTLATLTGYQGLAGFSEVLELNARGFVAVVTEITRLNTIINDEKWSDNEEIVPDLRRDMTGTVQRIVKAATDIDARLTVVAARRFEATLANTSTDLNLKFLRQNLRDLESRFADELNFIRFFVLSGEKAELYGGADTFVRPDTAANFPSVRFDCDEAARCLALGRPTACVFHAMRMIEIAVKAIAKRLSIPDPIKPAERNWAIILKRVHAALEQHYPSPSRLPASEGAFLEGVYVTLDAIKNPWRNATMHVDSVYTDEEARHIFRCTTALLDKMAQGFDENGLTSFQDLLSFDEG